MKVGNVNDIEIRAIRDPLEASKVEVVQQETWGIPEVEVIPARLLHALQFTGSCLLGAYDGSTLVGFVLGVLGTVEDLKNRIGSVKNTRKITKAMQMVAAAKLRRAQEAAEAARPFAERMTAVMSALAAGVGTGDGAPKLLAGNGREQVHLLVVMTSERGLCGGFNSSIVKLARLRANELAAAGKTVKMLTVGKKGR